MYPTGLEEVVDLAAMLNGVIRLAAYFRRWGPRSVGAIEMWLLDNDIADYGGHTP